MARKRKLDAGVPEQDLDSGLDTESQGSKGMGGMWAGSAMNMLKQRMDDAHASLTSGILAGTVAIEIEPDQIEDKVGTDRFGRWEKDEEFHKLVANIKRRGQTQPIRVRPADADWAPDPGNPLKTDAKFYVQSGRRRLRACRDLGQAVLAVVSTEDGDAVQADLEERFLENTMRQNLNGFEELVSIGALAQGMKDLSQTEIAERLGVAQGDVSLGKACLKFEEAIVKQINIDKTPKRAYRAMIPKLKRGEKIGSLLPAVLTGDAPQPFDVRGVPMVTKPSGKGFAVNIRKADIAEADLEKMLVDLAKVVMKYQIRRKG